MDKQSLTFLPAGFTIAPAYDTAQLVKTTRDAVRWHYYDMARNDGPGGYEGRGLPPSLLAAFEGCVPGEAQQLKSEAAKWARLWHSDSAPDTWEKAQVILTAKEGRGEV